MFIHTLRVSILLTVALVVPTAFAQTATPDVQNKPRKIKSEPDNSFKRWVVDVEPIITPEELKAWNDRGRIFLKYGKPDEIESHPAGGAYERQPSEGGGSTSTYPFERWWYRNLPGRSDVEVEFVDPTGTGEYRIARNPFEKEALLNVPGAGASMDGISQADRVVAANGFGNPFSGRAKDSEFEWMDMLRLRDEASPVNFD